MPEGRVDKHSVRSAFNRAAASYDRAAAVQREICHRLAAFALTGHQGAKRQRILDAGCGTGYGLNILRDTFPDASSIAIDFAPAMLEQLMHSANPDDKPILPVCGDLEALPLASGSFDLVWSSLALQWCDPNRSLGELARVLKLGGMACIATLGPRTLWELREAFAAIDQAEHVIRFHEADFWLAAARDHGLQPVAHTREDAFALAPDLRRLLRDIKSIGAQTVGEHRRRQPLGRAAWNKLEARYEAHRRPDGLLPATYDLILLTLKKP
ncbi:malonyl-ACP O-methyltransferase BioC [Azoarcus sp. KH32C]|uniref:malonyl-ACP O-methyltransferase BioC n=1 Tax=Azoarcus sp. KH32C TaxID=748247 RepID=UPI0002386618|nr:malonyl-ACP O-methyltransferase BioC [Azoarcus sp. KH32C]BAL24702.1 biotin synthesis protein [Azoarcus sp. KH32C]